MKKALLLGLALALVSGGVAYANFCARDYVPAATLLVPYAVVDLNADGTVNANGYTTLLAVTNVSSAKQVIHVTVWTPKSAAVVDFDEVLTGYDVWTINFRDLLTGHFDYFDTEGQKGIWGTSTSPVYGAQKSGTDSTHGNPITPWGPSTNRPYTTPLIQPQDTDFGAQSGNPGGLLGCQYPYGYHPEYGSGIVSSILGSIASIQGTIKGEDCKGNLYNPPAWIAQLNPNRAFFYVTIDAVNVCSQAFPSDAGYWAMTNGVPTIPDSSNVLIGDIMYVNQALNYSESYPAVSIEAGPYTSAQMTTFYRRYDHTGADNREPLGTAFAFRYLNFGTTTSDLVFFKTQLDRYFDSSYQIYVWDYCSPFVYFAWDENENAKSRTGGPSGFNTPEPNPLPLETQDVPLTVANFNGLMQGNGWMMIVFDNTLPINDQVTNPILQGWAGVRYLSGGYSTLTEAATMANVNCFPAQTVVNGLPSFPGYTLTQ